MNGTLRICGGLANLALLALSFHAQPAVAQHIETSTFNQAPARQPNDPAIVAQGKSVYGKSCQRCHSGDLRGTETGPNLLRSQDALIDRSGERLIPIELGQDANFPNHNPGIARTDAAAVASYLRSVLSDIGSQGRPPGDAALTTNILVGDAERGKQYFAKVCGSCHSVEGDLKGFASKVTNPKLMQAAWLRGTYLGAISRPVTVAVSEPNQAKVKGTLIHIDDFMLTLQTQTGEIRTFRRKGLVPEVEVNDPLDKHRALLPHYLDSDIHDVTAYLTTLK